MGTDIDEHLLDAARSFLEAEGISNVDLVVDDLFESKLEPRSFDLVHGRFLIAPLGRGREQLAAHRRLLKPGGWLVLEEWDTSSWHFNPPAPASERLIRLMYEIFATRGGEAGRELPALFREIGIADPGIDAHVIALKPGHPYLRLPLQFSVSLERLLLQTVSADELASLRGDAEVELADPEGGERRSPWSRVGARSKAAVKTRLSRQPDLHPALECHRTDQVRLQYQALRSQGLTAGCDDAAPGKSEAWERTRWISERSSSHRS